VEVPTGYLGPVRSGEDKEGLICIYFIEVAASGRVKIGKADNLEKRLKQL